MLRRQHESFGQRQRKSGDVVIMNTHRKTKQGQRRRNQKVENTMYEEMEAARQLLQLCNHYGSNKKIKTKSEGSKSETSLVTNEFSAMETRIIEGSAARQQMKQPPPGRNSINDQEPREDEEEEEEESTGDTSDLSSVVIGKGIFLPIRKRKFRSLVDIYTTTKPLDVVYGFRLKNV